MDILEHYLFTKEHEWINIEDNIAVVGITDYAQSALGDITYIELPDVGAEVEQFERFVSVESVKAASDIYAPMSGKVVEVNEHLESDPEERSNLLTAEEYRKFLESIEDKEN